MSWFTCEPGIETRPNTVKKAYILLIVGSYMLPVVSSSIFYCLVCNDPKRGPCVCNWMGCTVAFASIFTGAFMIMHLCLLFVDGISASYDALDVNFQINVYDNLIASCSRVQVSDVSANASIVSMQTSCEHTDCVCADESILDTVDNCSDTGEYDHNTLDHTCVVSQNQCCQWTKWESYDICESFGLTECLVKCTTTTTANVSWRSPTAEGNKPATCDVFGCGLLLVNKWTFTNTTAYFDVDNTIYLSRASVNDQRSMATFVSGGLWVFGVFVVWFFSYFEICRYAGVKPCKTPALEMTPPIRQIPPNP